MKDMSQPARGVIRLALAALTLLQPSGEAVAQDRPVRPAALEGQFYPADAARLRRAVEALMARAVGPVGVEASILIAPHAALIFSGQVAADAYRQAAGATYDTVILLGVNHTTAGFRKVAVDAMRDWRTPLGTVAVDRELGEALLAACRDCVVDDAVHAEEHSIEVHVPFVQVLWPAAKILPVVVGEADPGMAARLGEALATLSAGRRLLIVASSDLSHYPPAQVAREVDRRTLDIVSRGEPGEVEAVARGVGVRDREGLETTACGAAPIMAALSTARALGLGKGRVVSYANSADVAVGDPGRVVGYGAMVFGRERSVSGSAEEAMRTGLGEPGPGGPTVGVMDGKVVVPPAREFPDPVLTPDGERAAMLAYSRAVLEQFLLSDTLPMSRLLPAHLADRRQGVFVTLRHRGELRGCIGRIEPDGPLPWVLGGVTLQSALRDPRFQPVTPGQLREIDIEIALLTPLRRISSPFQVVPGRDGVVLSKAGRSSVFLPHVAVDEGWTRDEMLDHLAVKAGLSADAWRVGADLFVFQAEVFNERSGQKK